MAAANNSSEDANKCLLTLCSAEEIGPDISIHENDYHTPVPADRIAKLLNSVAILMSEGVNTPDELAARLDQIAEATGKPKALRKFSFVIWKAFQMLDTRLADPESWEEIYFQNDKLQKALKQRKAYSDALKAEQDGRLARKEARKSFTYTRTNGSVIVSQKP